MKEFTVFLKSSSELSELAQRLGERGINIITLSMDAATGSGAVVHLVSNDERTCREVLALERHNYREEEIFTVTVDDKPGALARLLMKIKKSAIGIRSIYIINKRDGKAEFVLNLDDLSAGKKLLFDKLGLEP